MKTAAEPSAAAITSPGLLTAPATGLGRGTTQQPATARPRPGRAILRGAASAAIIAAVFGFALPRIASYRSVGASMAAMTWPQVLLVAATAAASMASAWVMICSVLPSIRLREAAVVNLGSNAVANTLPAGGALAMGVSWAMLSSWGISTAEYVLYSLVSGIWNVFARLGLPVLALLVLATVGRPGAGLIAAAAVGLALLAVMAAGLALLIRSESFAVRAGRALQRVLAAAGRLARRQPPPGAAGWLPGFRDRAAALIAARGWRITAATAASNLTLWLVLLACLRGIGLSQAQVPWQTSLAAFAFVRLLTVLPITPGGLGITELGLIAILAAGAGHRASAQVTAAVLLYRAVTYLPPIPLGAIACLVWRHAPGLIRTSPQNTSPAGHRPASVPAPTADNATG
ncbi:MAG TPA: YbhN family protein [Streptosporangiaceae bacterium]|nr:YbhN family protein [Streptosporangiaceae bacterium]